MYHKYELIEDNEYIGFLETYLNIDKNSEIFRNYFLIEEHVPFESIKKIFESIHGDTVSILKYVEVESNFLQKGNGRKLLNMLKKDSVGSIILICDISDDFVHDWYEKEGFVDILPDNEFDQLHLMPIMVLNR